ncbi:MAG: cytochrome P450 [Caulobacteraceae bacterium]
MSEPAVTDEQRALIPEHVPQELVRPAQEFSAAAGPAGTGGKCPYERLSEMHGGPPIVYTAPTIGFFGTPGSWLLTKAKHIRAVLQQPDVFSSKGIAGFSRLVGESWDLIPLELDPPEHGKFRALMNSIFAPAKISAMEDGVRARAIALIDAVSGKCECEFVEAFGRPFPVSIFMQLMGLPDEEMQQLNEWEHGLLHSGTLDERLAAAHGFLNYLRELIAARRREPTNDLTTFAIQAEVDGRALTDDEVMGMCYLLVVAGLDTVAASLGLHFRHLAQNPEDQARLRASPALIPSAVEELLRRYATVTTSRFATQDVEIGGIKMMKGDRVTCSTMLASLDPDEFDRSMDVDISRSPNRHVAFSYGPHRCIGSHLARRELTIAMEEWLKRVPPFRTKGGVDVPVKLGGLLGVDCLPLEWRAA